MRISDWSSDVCSSDLAGDPFDLVLLAAKEMADARHHDFARIHVDWGCHVELAHWRSTHSRADVQAVFAVPDFGLQQRSEERRGGKECVSTCRSRWAPVHSKKHKIKTKTRSIKD